VLVPISLETGLTLANLNAGKAQYHVSVIINADIPGTGYMFLFFGWGCVVWQPLALQYGKRPVYLFSILATVVRNRMIWKSRLLQPS